MTAQASAVQLTLDAAPLVMVTTRDDIRADLEAVRAIMYDADPSSVDVARLARVLARHDKDGEVWTYARGLGVESAPRLGLLLDFWRLVGLPCDDLAMTAVEVGVWLKARGLWSPGGVTGDAATSRDLTVPVIGGWALRVRRNDGLAALAPVEWMIQPPNPNPRARRPAKAWMLNLVNVDIFARFLEDAAKAAQRHRQEQSERSAKKRAERMSAQEREAWQAQQEELARQQARRLQEAVMRCVGTEIKVRLERLGVDPDEIVTHAARFTGQGDLVKTWRGREGRVLWGSVNPSGDIHLATRSDDAPNRFDAPPVMDEYGAFEDLDFAPLVRWLAGVAS